MPRVPQWLIWLRPILARAAQHLMVTLPREACLDIQEYLDLSTLLSSRAVSTVFDNYECNMRIAQFLRRRAVALRTLAEFFENW